jgi:hypothetical protein
MPRIQIKQLLAYTTEKESNPFNAVNCTKHKVNDGYRITIKDSKNRRINIEQIFTYESGKCILYSENGLIEFESMENSAWFRIYKKSNDYSNNWIENKQSRITRKIAIINDQIKVISAMYTILEKSDVNNQIKKDLKMLKSKYLQKLNVVNRADALTFKKLTISNQSKYTRIL